MADGGRRRLGYGLSIAGVILQIGTALRFARFDPLPPPAVALVAVAILLIAAGIFILARLKGYSGLCCLLALFSVFALIAIAKAPDRRAALASHEGAADYASIPWHRQSEGMSTLLGVGLLMPFVLIVAVCVCATGDIYTNKRDSNGNFVVWSMANRYAAVALLLFWIIAAVVVLGQWGAAASPR